MSSKDSAHDESDREVSKYFNLAFMVLGYLGLIPFAVALLVIFSEKYEFGYLSSEFIVVDPQIFFVTYSVAILSFLAGTLWQQQFFSSHGCEKNLVLSNAVVVAAWVGLVATLVSKSWIQTAVTTNMLGFLVLLARERKAMFLDLTYRKMRHRLTFLVALMHLLMLVFMLPFSR